MFISTSDKQWRCVAFGVYVDRNKAWRLVEKNHGMYYRKPPRRGLYSIVHPVCRYLGLLEQCLTAPTKKKKA